MRERKSKGTPEATGPEAQIKTDEEFSPPLLEDDPLYTAGWIVGQTFRGWSPAEARQHSKAKKSAERPTMTEEQIQTELQRMRAAGYGTVELSFAEDAMRGLEGKPKGNA